MILFRIASYKYIKDISGQGARLYGGRWNSIGIPALYTSTSISLAFLELLANMDIDNLPGDLSLATVEFEGIPFVPGKIPESWDKMWPSPVSQKFGDSLLNKVIAFQVPSMVIPQERNIMFSPIQKDFMKQVRINSLEPFKIDGRIKEMLKGK